MNIAKLRGEGGGGGGGGGKRVDVAQFTPLDQPQLKVQLLYQVPHTLQTFHVRY